MLDVHTTRIVDWQPADHMRQSLVTDAIEMAIAACVERSCGLVPVPRIQIHDFTRAVLLRPHGHDDSRLPFMHW